MAFSSNCKYMALCAVHRGIPPARGSLVHLSSLTARERKSLSHLWGWWVKTPLTFNTSVMWLGFTFASRAWCSWPRVYIPWQPRCPAHGSHHCWSFHQHASCWTFHCAWCTQTHNVKCRVSYPTLWKNLPCELQCLMCSALQKGKIKSW